MYEVLFSEDRKKLYTDLKWAMSDMDEMLEDGEQAIVIRTDNDESLDFYIVTKLVIPRQYARYNPVRIAFEHIEHEQLYNALMYIRR